MEHLARSNGANPWSRILLDDRRPSDAAKVTLDRAVFGTLVSFPKSGRTWLRVMLDELAIPMDYDHDGSAHATAMPMGPLMAGPRGVGLRAPIVFLYRDPLDTAVSGFFQASLRLRNYLGDIGSFVLDPRHGVEKIARFNLAWLEECRRRSALAVTYEELSANPAGILARLCDYLGVTRCASELDATASANTFAQMQRKERDGAYRSRYGGILAPRDSADINSFKVRRGRVGGYRDELSASDIATCEAILDRLDYRARTACS